MVTGLHFSRRRFLAATAATAGLSHWPLAAAQATSPVDLEAALGGRIGFFARNPRTGHIIAHRARERFAMCSTFKAVLAAHMLEGIAQGRYQGDEELAFSSADVLPASPITSAVSTGTISLLSACEAIVSFSDNTAANLLLQRSGGPARLTGYFRELGDRTSRLDRYELDLNNHAAGDARDTTSPRAMGRTIERLLLSDRLHIDSRHMLIGWMENERNGTDRLRAGVPAIWRTANKPGTNTAGAVNDIGMAWSPAGEPIVLAAYIDAPLATGTSARQAIAWLAQFAVNGLASGDGP